MILNAI